jgi:hypothetical protein
MNEEIVMNRIIFEDGTMFTSVEFPIEAEPCIFDKQSVIRNEYRDVLRITVASTYEEVVQKFVDNAKFVIRQREVFIDDKGNEYSQDVDYEKYEYVIAGDIIDHRDGRITVYMGKMTEHELEVAALENENAELLFSNLTGEEFFEVDAESANE